MKKTTELEKWFDLLSDEKSIIFENEGKIIQVSAPMRIRSI